MKNRISIVIVCTFFLLACCTHIYSFQLYETTDENNAIPIEPDIVEKNKRTDPVSSATRSGDVTFTNVTDEVGLSGVRGDSYAWGDYNNDGYQDLLLKDHINGKSHLYKNNGPPDWDFSDVTEDVGLEGAGYAVWGDYNNDGFLDFFSVGHTNDNPDGSWDTLWMNNGPPNYTFTNMTGPAGNMNDGMPGLAAGWADYDRDGFLDLYVVNWRDLDNNRYPDVLYHNNGDGTFSDVTLEAGVHEGDEPYAGMGVNWGDYNNDGWPDIYVSNYLVTPNYLYENNMDGTFTDVAFEKNAAGDAPAGEYYGHTAGSSWADYDHDGDLDMWVSNLAHTTDPRGFYTDYSQMLRNDGPDYGYSFTDVRDETGIEKKPYMSEDELHFGIAWGDYDNDGDMDMFIPQVKNLDYAYSYFFENNGDGTYINVSDDVGVRVWNTDGACWADYNNDGYIDLITEGKYPYENGTYEVRLFKNNGGSTNHWMEVKLCAKESNRAAIGARVKISYNGIIQMKEIEGGTAGHAYQHSLVQHFGFGDYDETVEVEIWWPSGMERVISDCCVDQMITIYEITPDLKITDISFSNDEPEEGETVSITATIENINEISADSAVIKFFDGDITSNPIETKSLLDIHPHDVIDVQIEWDTTDKEGSHTITVLIEDVGPDEENTQNNVDSKPIMVTGDGSYKPPPPEEEVNNPPVITSISAEPSSILIGERCILSVDAEDADGDTLSYIYECEAGDISGNGNVVFWYAPLEKGIYEIIVIVRDSSGDEDTGSVKVEVLGNTPPSIQAISVSSDTANNNGIDTVLFKVQVRDENGLDDIEWVRIDLSQIGGSSNQKMYDDGTHKDEAAQDGIYSYEVLIPETVEPGEKTITITVKDKSGEETSDEIHISIFPSIKEEGDDTSVMDLKVLLIIVTVILVLSASTAIIYSRKRNRMNNS